MNRVLAKVLGEAMNAVDTGTSFETVDHALDRIGLPMTPFELLELVGLKVSDITATHDGLEIRLGRSKTDQEGKGASIGLPPVRRIWSRWVHSPDLTIGAWPEWFAPRQPDWPPQAQTSGFPVFDEVGRLDPALERFIEDARATGTAPIGITAGSAMAHGGRFYARALDACRALDVRVVLVTAFAGQLPSPLPGWAHRTAYAPFSTLLPRLAALIHHGGIGTSAQALAAGIPQAIVPFAHDQFDNAARLRRLGVSTTLGPADPVGRWTNGLHTVLSDPAVRAAVRLGQARMRDAGRAADGIADRIERLST